MIYFESRFKFQQWISIYIKLYFYTIFDISIDDTRPIFFPKTKWVGTKHIATEKSMSERYSHWNGDSGQSIKWV